MYFVVGVNGVGNIGWKYARQADKCAVTVGASDVFRVAAVDQPHLVGSKVNVPTAGRILLQLPVKKVKEKK